MSHAGRAVYEPTPDEVWRHLTDEERDELDHLLALEERERVEWPPDCTLKGFAVEAWKIVEPADPYLDNWHVDAICEHLEAVSFDRIRHLLINIPPRCMKSLLVAVFWFCWLWTFRPWMRFLYASYAQTLSTRDSVKCRQIITSPWYQQRWGARFQLAGDQNAKMRFENSRRGFRVATSTDGMATGEGGHIVCFDDPHNVVEAESDLVREGVVTWWNRAMSTRLNNQNTGHKVGVMQRLHERDVAGDIVAKMLQQEKTSGRSEWVHLKIPNEYEPKSTRPTVIGWRDPRREKGQLLWPARLDAAVTAGLKVTLGSYGYAGQMQQEPSPAEGGIFKVWWWRYWQPEGMHLPPVIVERPDGLPPLEIHPVTLPPLHELVLSWDMSFKDVEQSITGDPDPVSGQVWGVHLPNAYLLDRVGGQWDFVETVKQFVLQTRKWPQATAKYIEDKANGPAVIAVCRQKIPGLIAVNPDGDKVARARAVSPYHEAGNIFVPHPQIAPWVADYIQQHTVFPNGTYDDDVDGGTQAARKLLTMPGSAHGAVASESYFTF